MAKKDEAPLTFEQSVSQLEQIVQAIESGQIGLEDSLARYEQGMKLVQHCRGILDKAEKRMEVLSQTPAGLKAEPLENGNGHGAEHEEVPF